MKKYLVSIIVPVYNVERYIEQCIKSLCSQTYDNIEIVLVDDGSSDNSGFICDDYSRKDSRIKVIHKKNEGVSKARKKGLEKSIGEYIAFVDSDDYVENNYIEELINRIINKNVDVVCCNCIDEGIDGQPNICILKEEILENLEEKIQNYYNGMRFAYVIWGKLFKREIIEKIEFYNQRYTEDTHMMLKVFEISKDVVLIPYRGYHYRAQEGSAMAKAKLIDVYRDTLITIKYLNILCYKLDIKYYNKANKRMLDTIYGAVLSNCEKNDWQKEINISDYLEYMPKKISVAEIKKILLIKMYRINKNITSWIIRLIKRK